MQEKLKFVVDMNKLVLSSTTNIYQTQNFLEQTKYLLNIEVFISKIAETIIKNLNKIEKLTSYDDVSCFMITADGCKQQFLFKFGDKSINTTDNDIIFFEMINKGDDIKQNDMRLKNFLKTHNKFEIDIVNYKRLTKIQDFAKLYIVSNTSGVNLPRLDINQQNIVTTVDKNMMVQGVAGSGKTNVCIEKIIFSACRNYTNKVLYSTFSRGLLNDTKLRVSNYISELEDFVLFYESGCVEFVDNNHKKALENKYGIFFFSEDDEHILYKIKNVINYLKNKVDYLLIQDIYKNVTGINTKIANENYFMKNYIPNIKNHQIKSGLQKLEKVSHETIYKEIFGMINGFCDIKNPLNKMTLNDYVKLRKDSFSSKECEIIYAIGQDYYNFLLQNNMTDINIIARELIKNIASIPKYALSIIDEVQDYSQVALYLLSKISIKMFCVGDALQMINPSYFNFSYLKNLLYEDEFSDVRELKHNYRNTKKIAEIVGNLANINRQTFGVHNFVLESSSIDSGIKTNTIYVEDDDFIKLVAKSSFDNFTFVVDSQKEKEDVKKILQNQEVLTVSEIKGLERDTVVAYNLLSNNKDRWKELENMAINRKTADENSVYRYYYNIFYVGITRAKQNLFVFENSEIPQFEEFFSNNFKRLNSKDSISALNKIVSKIEFTDSEIQERVNEFIKLEQYDNARFIARKVKDDILQKNLLATIDINEQFIQYGHYRDAGIKFWELGLTEQAKSQFILSGDDKLITLIDAVSDKNSSKLDINIVDYYLDLIDNETARDLILDTVKNDFEQLKNSFSEIKKNLKGERNVRK